MRGSPTTKSPSRSRAWSRFWIPLGLVISTVLLGWIGFARYFAAIGQPVGPLEAFFHAAGLPILETVAIREQVDRIPIVLNVARLLALTFLPYAFVLAFLALFGDLTKPVRIRSWRWRARSGARGHAVVCGLGVKGYEIGRDLRAQGRRVAAAEIDPENGFVLLARGEGVVVLHADATHLPTLRDLDLAAAETLFVVCGSDEANLRVLQQAGTLVAGAGARNAPLECSVEIRDRRTRDFAHRSLAGNPHLYLHSFDSDETTSRQLLDAYPLEAAPGEGDARDVQAVILGSTSMARAIRLQCLLLGHFPHPRQLRITSLVEDVEQEQRRFLSEYPCYQLGIYAGNSSAESLRQQALPPCIFSPLPVSDALLLDERRPPLRDVSDGAVTSIYICIDDGLRSAAYASALLPALAAAARNGARIHVYYYHNDPDPLQRVLAERKLRELAPGVRVVAFDNFLDGCSADRAAGRPADDLAREIARLYQAEFGGDSWREMSEADRMSNRRAADHLLVKLRAIGAGIVPAAEADPDFRISDAEVVALAEMEHRRWSADKLLEGWRPLPRTPESLQRWRRDKTLLKAQKLHVDLVPFAELDLEGQAKDRSQILDIPALVRSEVRGIRRHLPEEEPRAPTTGR